MRSDVKKTSSLVYKCSTCGTRDVKLWRQYQTVRDALDLLCLPCAKADQGKDGGLTDGTGAMFEQGETDSIGWLVPAVPTELPGADGIIPKDASYWGYTSVPDWGVEWWYDLPPKIPHPHPGLTRKMRTRDEEEAEKRARAEAWDRETNQRIQETEFVVDATSNEVQTFWLHWHTVLVYEQISSGMWAQIGDFHGHPVAVSVQWYRIEGKLVAFVEPTSRVVDHGMVDKWIEKTFPVVHARGIRETRADAMNFHNCLLAIAPNWAKNASKRRRFDAIQVALR